MHAVKAFFLNIVSVFKQSTSCVYPQEAFSFCQVVIVNNVVFVPYLVK